MAFALRTVSAFRVGCFRRSITMCCQRSQQAQQQPTYGDVFNAQGNIRDKPITPQDAARMKAAERATIGQAVKGGTAAKMQSAVDKSGGTNASPAVDDVDSSLPALDEVGVPGTAFVDVVELADAIVGKTADTPITIGEALEAAGESLGSKPLMESDARVIQSAEGRATGNSPGVKRVVADEARVAANINESASIDAIPTIQDVLSNATEKMEVYKVVTKQDAARVQAAERRNSPSGNVEAGGIAATIQSAADMNVAAGVAPEDGDAGRIVHNL